MKIALATICLNEMEWLEKNYLQHRSWPGLCKWVFVEAADRVYKAANPEAVSSEGLSLDDTTDFLKAVAASDGRILHIPFGVSGHPDPAQCKTPARNACTDTMERERPDWLITIDADEFYTEQHQQEINNLLESLPPEVLCTRFATRDIWRPESSRNRPLLQSEVTGGRFFGMSHTRFWRWKPGLRYKDNHNWLQDERGFLTRSVKAWDRTAGTPQCVHLGWASDPKLRKAKNAYYVARGEGRGDGREDYVRARRAWETWKPGDALPDGAHVVPYDGPVPECFG